MPRAQALALCACAALLPFLVACGDDDDAPATAAASTTPSGQTTTEGTGTAATGTTASATTTTPTPRPGSPEVLDGPVGKYVLSIDDLGVNWITSVRDTYVITASEYAATRAFSSAAEGTRLLAEWGYEDGYQTVYAPEGRDTAVLNGAFYISTEAHRFADDDGAEAAFDYFVKRAAASPGMEPVSMADLGDESKAFVATIGKVGMTNVDAVFHQVIFRRGNVVVVVLTKGAEGFMTVDSAHDLAEVSDRKTLGEVDAIEPTPTSNFTPPAGSGN